MLAAPLAGWMVRLPVMVSPALETLAAVAVVTKAVVAIWVVLVPAVAVGAAGVPVNVGEAIFARAAEAARAETETIDDSRGSAAYKSVLVAVYARRVLEQASFGVKHS